MNNKKVHSVRINLLTEKSLNLKEKLLFFALHYLRYIIVLTQITVIMVFLYRFHIDQQIIDLREDVAQKREILRVTAPLVAEAKTTEKRLSQAKVVMDKQTSFNRLFDFVLSTIPEDIILDEITIDEKLGVTIRGQSKTIASIRGLYEVIKKKEYFKNTVITDIGRTADTGNFRFIIVGTYE